MSISDLGSIGEFLSGIAVLATLVYLTLQLKHGRMLARAQHRQHMVEQANEELYKWMSDPDLRDCFTKATELSREEQGKLHYFLLASMRQREWEWFQYRDGVIDERVYQAYREVIGLQLGIPRTRRWWSTVGRVGLNSDFVSTVDAFLLDRPPITYFEDILTFDRQSKNAT